MVGRFVMLCLAGATFGGLLLAAVILAYQPGGAGAVPGSPSVSVTPALPSAAPTPTPELTSTPSPELAKPVTFSILTAGDLLYHVPVMNAARTANGYDFTKQFDPLKKYIEAADIAICQFEVPVAPPGVTPAGYPLFAVPAEAVAALPKVGWDGCTTSSNHSIDQGWTGLELTLQAMDKHGIKHTGTYLKQQDYWKPAWYTVQKEGRTIQVAHLAGTFGLNGLVLPQDKQWGVSLTDVDRTIAEAKKARKAGADIVIYAMQEGVEYQSQPSDHQRDIVARLAKSGQIDMVFGNHPHVPQPLEKVNGGPGNQGMWVIYSHGNLISNQSAACCSATSESGVLALTTITAPPDGPPRVTGMKWTGVIVDKPGGYRVYPLTKSLDAGQRPSGMVMSQGHVEGQARLLRNVMGAKYELQTPVE